MVYLIVFYSLTILKIPDFFLIPFLFWKNKSSSVRMDAIPVLSGNRLEYLQNAIFLILRVIFFSYFMDKLPMNKPEKILFMFYISNSLNKKLSLK